ncbi:hypothetical protein MRX96_048346 [Rhipicephalus microplus]
MAAGCTSTDLRTVGLPAVVSARGAADGHVYANGQVPYANDQVLYANGASTEASFQEGISKKVAVVAEVPPCSAQLRPNHMAAAIPAPALTINGVSHGVVVGATANGPRSVAPHREGVDTYLLSTAPEYRWRVRERHMRTKA